MALTYDSVLEILNNQDVMAVDPEAAKAKRLEICLSNNCLDFCLFTLDGFFHNVYVHEEFVVNIKYHNARPIRARAYSLDKLQVFLNKFQYCDPTPVQYEFLKRIKRMNEVFIRNNRIEDHLSSLDEANKI